MAKKHASDTEVKIDRRQSKQRRDAKERRSKDVPVSAERRRAERRKVTRRRQIDPTTCERDYTEEEIEFMHALDRYKRSSGRMFPTCSEILEVIRNLGYERQPTSVTLVELEPAAANEPSAESASDHAVEAVENSAVS